ncbi:MAG: PAS domain-containing sensor histidine kinase [Gemmatimonadota bacterium]
MSIPGIVDPASPPPTPSPWLHALVANVQDAIVLLDAAGRVTYESPSACEILGIPPDDVLGAFGMGRIHPDERDAVMSSFERTIASPGAVARATYRFQRADGNWRHLEALAKNLLDDPHLRGVLITFRDVTERIRALEAAEEAGRARDEFLSRMSHELRTPLHAILGWAQLLESAEGPELEEAAEQITTAGHHLLRLVEEALDLAAIQEGRVVVDATRVTVREVVVEAVDLIRPLADRRDIQVQIAAEQTEVAVLADRDRLRQVLLNLLSNAVKYNRYAGDVRIHWERASSRLIAISVSDTGPGMHPAMLDRIFQRFERLGMEDAGIEGSGLGLAISNRIVEMMGGTMAVETRPGDGAVLRIELPAA